MTIKELMEKRAAKMAAIEELRKNGIANLDSDKRAELRGLIDEVQDMDNTIGTERQIDALSKQPKFQLPKDGKRSYSLRNVILARCGERVDIGFESEVGQELALRSGIKATGILVPVDVINEVRAGEVTAGSNTGLIPTTIGEYGMALYPRTILDTLGVRVLTGLSGNIDWPVNATAASPAAKTEIAEAGLYTPSISCKSATPHRIPAKSVLSKQLILQAGSGIESFIQRELETGTAAAIEKMAFSGTGADGEFTGLTVLSGTSTFTNTGGTFSRANVIAAKKQLYKYAAPGMPRYGWALDPVAYEKGATTEISSGTGKFVYVESESDAMGLGRVGGFIAPISDNVGSGTAILTDWNQVIMQYWGAADLVVDALTLADQNLVKIVMNTFADMTALRPSLVIKNSVTIA